jgi:putative transposase
MTRNRRSTVQSISLREVLRQAQQVVSDPEDRVYGDMDSLMADGVKCLLEGIAASEVEQRLGVRLYERGEDRCGHRNGYRERGVTTPARHVTIRIPRIREYGYVPSFLTPRHRAIEEVEDYVASALLAGVSRAQIIRYMQDSTGCRPSDGLLKQVEGEIDRLAKEFKERQLVRKYAYLFLDAAWAKDIVGVHAERVPQPPGSKGARPESASACDL